MNFPSYEFCEENKSLLAQFIKKAKENKSNTFCNHEIYKGLSKFIPLINAEHCEDHSETIIDITQSDEDNSLIDQVESQMKGDTLMEEMPEQSSKNLNDTTLDDITYAIKENLETENALSSSVISNLHKPNIDLDGIFSYLSGVLNLEEVIHFGYSLKSETVKNYIISCYVRHLLLKKLTEEFTEQLQSVFNEFCKRYPDILKEEITNNLLSTNEGYSRVFLQFIDGLVDDFKSDIFKNFISSCEDLQVCHIGLIDILLNNQVDNDSLNKLVEVMSCAADNYTSEKSFGKLLISVLKLLGKNVATLEKPLSHIIESHRSVWKSKIQKVYDENFEESSLMMTQSFRF